jgi:hypothetical protein
VVEGGRRFSVQHEIHSSKNADCGSALKIDLIGGRLERTSPRWTRFEAAPMASQADVRRIALSLPETEEARNHFAFSVRNKGKLKGFVWVWMERVAPKKPRVPQPDVIAVRVANLDDKDSLLALNPAKFFTEPHYKGFPAVLVNLPSVTVGELKPLITEAWRCQAPKDLDLKKKPRVKRESS